ncbi:MAG TPA: hypothetical protein VIV11_11760 [Kofleriaceae bacterium]
MPRKAAKNVPGTERYRDERRKDGGPRMHGRRWHDHDEPHEIERVVDNRGNDAVIEAESGGDRAGMGNRRTAARATQSRERRKRSVPPGKGVTKRVAKQRAANKRANSERGEMAARPAGPRGVGVLRRKARIARTSGTRRKASAKGT